jgi:hypothetical protein
MASCATIFWMSPATTIVSLIGKSFRFRMTCRRTSRSWSSPRSPDVATARCIVATAAPFR